MIQTVDICDTFKVTVLQSHIETIEPLMREVNEIWKLAVRNDKELFDGTVLCVRNASAEELICFPAPYRLFYAANRNADLKQRLGLSVVAVCGVLLASGKIIVGRRAAKVTQYPGLLEFVPSGSLTASSTARTVDFRQQLCAELLEETGISNTSIAKITPMFLIKDDSAFVWDICCKIELKDGLEPDVILESFRVGEYSELMLMSVAELDRLMLNESTWVPTSKRVMIKMRREFDSLLY